MFVLSAVRSMLILSRVISSAAIRIYEKFSPLSISNTDRSGSEIIVLLIWNRSSTLILLKSSLRPMVALS